MKLTASDITVLVCVHSVAEWNDTSLNIAIQSLIRQDIEDFKILIVLDNCWERTKISVEKVLTPDITVIQKNNREGKQGLAFAKNFGLKHINTKLVAFLDADDEYLPDKLEQQLTYLNKHPETDFLGTHAYYRNVTDLSRLETSLFDVNTYNHHDDIRAVISSENVLTHGSMMIRMQALEKLGGYRHVKGAEDWDLWQRAFEAGFRFAQINERLYIYTVNTSVER